MHFCTMGQFPISLSGYEYVIVRDCNYQPEHKVTLQKKRRGCFCKPAANFYLLGPVNIEYLAVTDPVCEPTESNPNHRQFAVRQ
jgi:hypothetical protein